MSAGNYYINGKDFFTTFGIVVESGSDDFLKYPAAKETLKHDYGDANGVDVDLSRKYFSEKLCTLSCAFIAVDEASYWEKYGRFFAEISQPGTLRITIAAFNRSFNCYYKEMTTIKRLTKLKVGQLAGMFAAKFDITFVDIEPRTEYKTVAIIDETGRFITT